MSGTITEMIMVGEEGEGELGEEGDQKTGVGDTQVTSSDHEKPMTQKTHSNT